MLRFGPEMVRKRLLASDAARSSSTSRAACARADRHSSEKTSARRRSTAARCEAGVRPRSRDDAVLEKRDRDARVGVVASDRVVFGGDAIGASGAEVDRTAAAGLDEDVDGAALAAMATYSLGTAGTGSSCASTGLLDDVGAWLLLDPPNADTTDTELAERECALRCAVAASVGTLDTTESSKRVGLPCSSRSCESHTRRASAWAERRWDSQTERSPSQRAPSSNWWSR